MLCVEELFERAVNVGAAIGWLKALMARADANTKVLADWTRRRSGSILVKDASTIQHLGLPEGGRSRHYLAGSRRQGRLSRSFVAMVERERGFDSGVSRPRPAGPAHFWGGATVDARDVALLPHGSTGRRRNLGSGFEGCVPQDRVTALSVVTPRRSASRDP